MSRKLIYLIQFILIFTLIQVDRVNGIMAHSINDNEI